MWLPSAVPAQVCYLCDEKETSCHTLRAIKNLMAFYWQISG